MIPLEFELLLSVILFAIGFYGILVRKNAIVVLMCIELVLNAAIMNFVAFSSYANNPSGQVFALIAIALAAAEATIGLAIFLVLYRTHKSVELDKIKLLRW
jgi:NADH-quinone oxidoreductase subunit K